VFGDHLFEYIPFSKLYIRYHQLIYFRISKNKDIGGYVAITGSQASDILICELVIK